MFARTSQWRRWRYQFLRAGAAVALWVLAAFSLDRYGKARKLDRTYDVIIVAGCRVLPNGEASPSLDRRVLLAVELWRQNRAPRILLTGGFGKYPPSEAEVAAQIALRAGVPHTALTLEPESTSTLENAQFAQQLTDAKRVLLVTDSYHVYRARWAFRHFFQTVDTAGSISPWGPRTIGALREVCAVVYHQIREIIIHATR